MCAKFADGPGENRDEKHSNSGEIKLPGLQAAPDLERMRIWRRTQPILRHVSDELRQDYFTRINAAIQTALLDPGLTSNLAKVPARFLFVPIKTFAEAPEFLANIDYREAVKPASEWIAGMRGEDSLSAIVKDTHSRIHIAFIAEETWNFFPRLLTAAARELHRGYIAPNFDPSLAHHCHSEAEVRIANARSIEMWTNQLAALKSPETQSILEQLPLLKAREEELGRQWRTRLSGFS